MNVGDMMTKELITCSPNDTITQAARKMETGDIGCCPVVENQLIVGLLTDRDIATRSAAKGMDPNKEHVSEIMTVNLVTVESSTSAEEAAKLMADYQVRRLPVVEQGLLVGMVSVADLAIDVEEEELVAEVMEKISEPSR